MRTGLASRRAFVATSISAAVAVHVRATRAQPREPVFTLPIGLPGRALGDGFVIRHGYATENTWYNPGWWHAGEDWYLFEGETAGVGVYAVADGGVVFAGSEYPGRVVIVRHASDLYSMYGHLDPDLAVGEGDVVVRGQLLGTVFERINGRAPSHLHFEVRTFLTKSEVNGDAPRYAAGCTDNCVPGPGYWPIDAPDHPSEVGWRNPTHVIANRMFDGAPPEDAEVVVASGASGTVALWSLPAGRNGASQIGELILGEGERFRLLGVAAGPEDSTSSSAEDYRLWYRIETGGSDPAWVHAAKPFAGDTGSDGRPSSIRFDFLPAVTQ